MRRQSPGFAASALLITAICPRPLDAQELTLEIIDTPATKRSLAPNLTTLGDHFALSWIQRGDKHAASVRIAKWTGKAFDKLSTIASSNRMFANWADIPAVIEAPSGDIYAHWLDRISSDTYAYGVRIARSNDDGGTWKPLGWLHNDESATEHGFVSFVTEGKYVRAFWLDGRAMTKKNGKMMLRTAVLDGDKIMAERVLDDDVCTCCPTSAAVLESGPMIVYRDRSPKEIRDISFTRKTSRGWNTPTRIHADDWLMPGCPVNGPSISTHKDQIAVARYTVVDNKAQIILNLSKTEEVGLGRELVLDSSEPIGRCATVCTSKAVFVLWIAQKDKGQNKGGAALILAEITYDGELKRKQTITAIDSARSSGMPRAVYSDGYLWVSWTDKKRVQLGRVKIER